MYKIIGADGKEYGPVTAEILKQWITQGRVNAQTRIFVDGATESKLAGEIPELAAAFAISSMPPLTGASAGLGGSPLPPDVRERDYELNIGDCLGRAWALLTGPRMWLVIGGVAIWLLIEAGLSGFAQIPLIGLLFSIASLVVGGPLMGGVFQFLLRNLRGEAAEVGNIFDGFRYCFAQLFLGQIVTALLTFAAALPGIVLIVAGFFPLFSHHNIQALGIGLIALGSLVALVPTVYLSVSWFFHIAVDHRQAVGFLASHAIEPRGRGPALVVNASGDHRRRPCGIRWRSFVLHRRVLHCATQHGLRDVLLRKDVQPPAHNHDPNPTNPCIKSLEQMAKNTARSAPKS